MEEKFLGDNWLLNRPEGIKLYHDIAVPLRKEVGIIDTHTHHNLRQIVENKPFPNIWRAEIYYSISCKVPRFFSGLG
jgi:glucuronate isomerase